MALPDAVSWSDEEAFALIKFSPWTLGRVLKLLRLSSEFCEMRLAVPSPMCCWRDCSRFITTVECYLTNEGLLICNCPLRPTLESLVDAYGTETPGCWKLYCWDLHHAQWEPVSSDHSIKAMRKGHLASAQPWLPVQSPPLFGKLRRAVAL